MKKNCIYFKLFIFYDLFFQLNGVVINIALKIEKRIETKYWV
jgi:hypothetical protein